MLMGSKICDACREKLANLPDLESVLVSHSPVQCHSDSLSRDEHYIDTPEALAAVNRCLYEIGETPLSESHNPKRIEDKIEKITDGMKGLFISDTVASSTHQDDESEIILQLKEKFHTTTKMSEQPQFYHKVGPGSGQRVNLVCLTLWHKNASSLCNKKVFSPLLIQSSVPHCHQKP